ncbi:MAG: AbgT family transporter [Gammaproteobacteria bacterium]
MSLLNRIESIGNRLPDPATLFAIATLLVMCLSQVAVSFDWAVQSSITGTLQARNLLASDGIWWFMSNMVENFIKFPPLAIVLVGMLGIGLAEKSGLLAAVLHYVITRTPQSLLTPMTIFLGIMSSITLDAGYVVLPPLAAALYIAAGRSPLAGIAAVFAGISAGFSANLFITALDPMLAGLTQAAAGILVNNYQVAVTANWWFMIASTVILTLTGWGVTVWLVEPRLVQLPCEIEVEPVNTTEQTIVSKGLLFALLSLIAASAIIGLLIFLPDAPLFGSGTHFPRWVEVTVPLLFLVFFIPGTTYGIATGTIKNDKDIARMLGETIAGLGPYIVLAFFAAQFIEAFKYSGLGEMLAISGGQTLAAMQLASPLLLCGFILTVIFANLLIGSASAKYAFLAPVFVPMLMQVGFSPELTQAAYRVGDSVSNVITPLNPYMIIILILVQKYMKGSGLGTLVAMMLPYCVVFAIVWSGLLVFWMLSGLPLGPGGQLHFNF